ncbi:MAG TPA: transglutaminaseTgpA domain-containing protein [Polyangiaceae bacterium]|jgi:transglutaminase-like putative cysteine protease|nr:transglutaminaseTgpA domain-containing protein [Polyangiaceae bacterium]
MSRLIAILPVLVASTALGLAAGDFTTAGAVAVLGVVFALVGPRFELDRGRQFVTSAMGAGVGYLVVTVLHTAHASTLADGWARFAAASVLAGAARFVIVRPSGGRMATMVLVFAALVAAGQTHDGAFPLLVALFLMTGVWAPAAHIEHDLLAGTSMRRVAVGAAIFVVAGAAALAGTAGVRRAYHWMVNRQRLVALNYEPSVGFSDQMDLGSLDGLIDSDTVVLRIRGGHVDYLRGAVLDFYAVGRWSRSDVAAVELPEHFEGDTRPGEPGGAVQVAAVSESTDRYFLPLHARGIATSPPLVEVDRQGALRRQAKRGLEVARFVVGDRDRADPAGPGATDLQIPRALRPPLEAMATEWTAGAATADDKLAVIQHRLHADFQYARAVQRFGGTDPVLQFLNVDRRGHCEYFATAMTLLARAQGIPARVVMGYRVGEESPFGYDIVRERNAHSWVEAWLPGRGWSSFDPTPDTEIPQNQRHPAGYLASMGDEAGVAYNQLVDWLQRRTVGETAAAWTTGLVVLFWIVARGNRRRVARATGTQDDAPLPCLNDLLTALALAGHPHEVHEPIERFAARLPDPEAARLLARCAALRYGSVGDAGTLASDVGKYTRRQRRRGLSAQE